jgi:allantoinase
VCYDFLLGIAHRIAGRRPMKYKFVPFPARQPLRWPNGKRLAVMITTNLEYWDATKDTPKPFYPGGPGIIGGELPGNVYDNPNWTWREYGQRVGVWRMFEVFDAFGVPSTCTMNAFWRTTPSTRRENAR